MDRLPDLIALIESVRAKHLTAPTLPLAPVKDSDVESERRAA